MDPSQLSDNYHPGYSEIGLGPNGGTIYWGPGGYFLAPGNNASWTSYTGAIPGDNQGPNGHEAAAPPPGTPPDASTPPPAASVGSGPSDPTSGGSQYPRWDQTFTPPPMLDLGGPPGLSYIPPAPTFDFKPPTQEEAGSDPGYQFTLQQGQNQVEQNAAVKGLLGTSGTLKNLVDYGQAAGATQYQNVYNRDLNLAQLKFNPLMTQYTTLATAGQHQNEDQYANALAEYQQKYKEFTDFQNADWTRKYQAASLI